MTSHPPRGPSRDAFVVQAAALRQAGRYGEAASYYRQAVLVAPQDAVSWYNLGYCARKSGSASEALSAYARAIVLGLDGAEEAHLERALIYVDILHQPDAAEAELNAALLLNPNYAPALMNLANLAEDRGRRPVAKELYQRLLSLEPHNWQALARAGAMQAGQDDALVWEKRLAQALSRVDLSDEDRASLGFARAQLLDRLGDYVSAFEAARNAKEASARAAGVGARYDAQAEDAYVTRILRAFSRKADPRPGDDFAPVFICGMFRSGSTLCEQVLAGHPLITPGGELELIPAIAAGRLAPYPERAASVSEDEVAAIATSYRDEAAQRLPHARIITDKRPDNLFHVGLIKRLFPRARIVLTERHPLDILISIHFLHLDASMSYAFDLMDTARHFRQQKRLASHWRSLYGEDVVVFDYDAFVRGPETEARALLHGLGLEWAPTCLEFHKRENAVRTASVWQVREPLYARSSGRWRNYAEALAPVRAYLADLLAPEAP